MLNDTIGAVSTPRGKGGVALLRLSGPDAVAITKKIFIPKFEGKTFGTKPRKAVYGTLLAPDADGRFVPTDDGLATFFPCPHSFTGEDVVEICCHGGALLTERILRSLFSAGARPAGAGEFTRRAFINGKMSLDKAEALGNMLEAKTDNQLTLGYSGLSGKVGDSCRAIYGDLSLVLSSVYARIDYPDEDLADLSREQIMQKLTDCKSAVDKLYDSYKTGHAVAEGIKTVICGCPNAGKSTLFNALVGDDKAIVTDVAGTTRDVLTDTVDFAGVTLCLSDTAGLHESDDTVEKIGIARAQKAMAEAELVLALFDGSQALTPEDEKLLADLQGVTAPVLYLLTKADKNTLDEWLRLPVDWVRISAKKSDGLSVLESKIKTLFLDDTLDLSRDAIVFDARQYASVLRCREALQKALDCLRDGFEVDMCCNEAELAMQAIAELDGRAVSEDIVSSIFSHFCVGK